MRAATLASLSASGWLDAPEVVLDDGQGATRLERIHCTWRRVVRQAAGAMADFVLLLEDDLQFGTWFAENLSNWPLLGQVGAGGAFFASLYNPERPFIRRHTSERWAVAYAHAMWGSQALLMTPGTARFIDAHWDYVAGNPDQRMPRLAARVTPVYLHVPSLVDHAPVPTTWGGIEHRARDFDPEFRARALQTGAG